MADSNQEILIKLKALDELTPVMVKALQNMESQTGRMADALNRLESPLDGAKDKSKGLNAGLLNLAAGWSLVKEAVSLVSQAYGAVSEQLGHAIDEAVEAQKVQNQLTGALVSTGHYTQDLSDKIENYSRKLEENKGISGEQTKALIAQAVQMGVSVEQALKMEEASRKLAAATGGTATEAFGMLQSAMAGQTRGLGKILPQVKELSEAQLKQGGAIAIVNQALDAQYKLYAGSYEAGVKKAQNALSNVYEAVGNIIIQNPLVLRAIGAFSDIMMKLQANVEKFGAWVEENQGEIEAWATAIGQGLQIGATALGVWAVAAGIAAVATGGLAAVVAIVASPITLAVAASIALVAALKMWPDLFDKIVGGLKFMVGFFIEGWATMLSAAASAASFFNNDLAASLTGIGNKLTEQADKWQLAGAQQIEFAGTAMATAKVAEDAVKAENKAIDSNLAKQSERQKAALQTQKIYAGFNVGTTESRRAMEAEVQQREKDLKDFESYMNNRMRIAVTKQSEQQAALAKLRSDTMTSGGPQDKTAGADSEIRAEEVKQQRLAAARQAGVLSQVQLEEELIASQERIRQQQLIADNAFTQARADALGESPAGFEARKALKESQFNAELQQRMEQAARAGASDAQLAEFEKQAKTKHQTDMLAMQSSHTEQEIALANEAALRKATALGNTPEALQMQMAVEEQNYQIRLAAQMERAAQEGATQAEMDSAKEQAAEEHKARMNEMSAGYWDREATMREQAGNDWGAFMAKMRAEQERHGAIIGSIRAVQNSEEYKGTMDMLGNLSSLRSSKSKSAFEVGKKAAIAEATVKTFMAATSAYASLAGIPIVGPALGAVAAAAAVAAGFVNIQKINSQKFDAGGQADSGMDSIPQSLSGKSFVLSGGERVVQPTANKALTEFLDKEKGGGSSGTTNNITLNYQGAGSPEDARKMAEMVIKEIRAASERGTQVMSSKGVY